jgi:hypothetical protein
MDLNKECLNYYIEDLVDKSLLIISEKKRNVTVYGIYKDSKKILDPNIKFINKNICLSFSDKELDKLINFFIVLT